MAQQELVKVPTIDYAGIYYPDLVKQLIQKRRINAPEVTDENEYEPFVQAERSFALSSHYSNVLLDVVANETLFGTSKLLETNRQQLKLIGYVLSQAIPSAVDVIYEFAKLFTTSTEFLPQDTQASTEETEEKESIIFESDETHLIDRTDEISYVFGWNTGYVKIDDNNLDPNDAIIINLVSFIVDTHFVEGATAADTAINLSKAINSIDNDTIQKTVKSFAIGDTVYLVNIDDSTTITVQKIDGATTNFIIGSGTFTTNRASEANTDALPFTPFTDPKPGDILYFGHKHIEIDRVDFILDTFAAGITGVWEYFDGELSDAEPTVVTNLGSTLKVDVSSLLPEGIDYSNTVVRVKFKETSAFEDCISYYSGGKNYIETSDLLGQSSPSEDESDYVIGSYWQPLPNIVDNTLDLQANESVEFTLPESQYEEWSQRTVNQLYNGYFLRYRIIAVVTPTAPIIDRIKIAEGAQYLKGGFTQGESQKEEPLGSSDGTTNQSFPLTYTPLVTATLLIEIDEGTGFTAWSKKDNFLSSGATSKDYVAEIKADDTVLIKFGDGVRGKIPAIGVDNIRAYYKTGAGENGNVGANTINVNKAGISFVNRMWNPRGATGWTMKEGSTQDDIARLKIDGPASIRVLNRGITPTDDEYLAENYRTSGGTKLVSRAVAFEETFGVKTIELICVGTGGTQLTQDQREEIEEYFNGSRVKNIDGVLVANHEVTVTNYNKKLIDVVATVTGGNKQEIENALRAYLHPEATYDDGVTPIWEFSTADNIVYVRTSLLYAEIKKVDELNIKNIVITTPAADVPLDLRELPFPGNINVTVL